MCFESPAHACHVDRAVTLVCHGSLFRPVNRTDPNVHHTVLVRREPCELLAVRRNLRMRTDRVSEKNFARMSGGSSRLHGAKREQSQGREKTLHKEMRTPRTLSNFCRRALDFLPWLGLVRRDVWRGTLQRAHKSPVGFLVARSHVPRRSKRRRSISRFAFRNAATIASVFAIVTRGSFLP